MNQWQDGKIRCPWANPQNPRYVQYHDQKWDRPVKGDHELFKMLILETFQAGLSWEIVLNKEEGFAHAFADFDVKKIAQFTQADQQRLQNDPSIIRHRLKINAAVNNAQVFMQIQKEWGSFAKYLWHWTVGKTIYETGQTHSPLSDVVSKDLKKRGMKFVGTKTVYAYLQAVGVVNSHEPGCFLYHATEPSSNVAHSVLML